MFDRKPLKVINCSYSTQVTIENYSGKRVKDVKIRTTVSLAGVKFKCAI